MVRQGGGAIVNNSSVEGLVGMQGSSAYAASKHGVVGLTKTAALEYAQSGIRVNAVCPGLIRTPMVQHYTGGDPETEAQLAAVVEPVGRMGSPDEIAEAVVWLCSEAASFVTGHALAVDGGYLAEDRRGERLGKRHPVEGVRWGPGRRSLAEVSKIQSGGIKTGVR